MRRFWTIIAGCVAVSCGASGDFGSTGTTQPSGYCTLVGCLQGAFHVGAFPIEGRDVSKVVLRACVNASCSETLVSLASQTRADCGSALIPRCSIAVRSGDNTLQLDIHLLPPLGADGKLQIRDDDKYEVSIAIPGQPPWIVLRGQAPYALSYPNGKGCEPECHTIRLAPVQSSGL